MNPPVATGLDHPLVVRAREIADDVLFRDAVEVDRTGHVPQEHWDLLAREGFYGLAKEGAPELPGLVAILEALFGGCLSTAFTWVQHQGAVFGLTHSKNTELRDAYLPDMLAGRAKAGVAFAGALADPPRLRAHPDGEGYLLDGDAPFVSGWGVIDVLSVSAVDPDGNVVSGLIDAREADGLSVTPLDLLAGQGTATVRLQFDDFPLPAGRVISVAPLAGFAAFQTFGSRLNASLACGVADRAIRLLPDSAAEAATTLRRSLDETRTALDGGLADPATLPAARAAASDLALRAAGALFAATGSTAMDPAGHPSRLLREAAFSLVAASRPEMRALLVDRLAD
ncbi:acyl-CoA dehydrogenase family protein [Pseudonocardia phyllosphaerae]|uniref:acyl-CoA dehydrogenase family protein n=1 Tax=Pseudonocardia phyllosphaerae TaxID=3390502 RepID=UPI003977FE24